MIMVMILHGLEFLCVQNISNPKYIAFVTLFSHVLNSLQDQLISWKYNAAVNIAYGSITLSDVSKILYLPLANQFHVSTVINLKDISFESITYNNLLWHWTHIIIIPASLYMFLSLSFLTSSFKELGALSDSLGG